MGLGVFTLALPSPGGGGVKSEAPVPTCRDRRLMVAREASRVLARSEGDYSSTIAVTGHSVMQLPHFVHFS